MDEVDVEDLNELESRLYAQIHHEAAAEIGGAAGKAEQQPQQQHGVQRMVTNKSVINRQANSSRVPAGRYWIGGQAAEASSKFSFGNNTKNLPSSPQSNAGGVWRIGESAAQKNAAPGAENTPKPPSTVGAQIVSSPANNKQPMKLKTPNVKSSSTNQQQQQEQDQQQNTSMQNKTKHGAGQQPKPPLLEPPRNWPKQDLIINPAAAKGTNKNKKHNQQRQHNNKQLQESAMPRPPSPPNILKNGPFAKQVQKLQKAKRLEEKKQKTKRVQDKQRKQKKPQQSCETIVLDGSDDEESDADDVILVQVPPPPVLTIYDSDDAAELKIEVDEKEEEENEKEKEETPAFVELGENALDASDVAMDNNNAATTFAKPQQSSLDKNVENASRCTSPSCSVQSADDFIGQNDRSRLLQGSGMADDEDLLLLTADVDSLMEMPRSSSATSRKLTVTSVVNLVPPEQSKDDEVEFVAPVASTSAAAAAKINYRVDQPQFRALDVYESESDITDNVYSKGSAMQTPKPTVIRRIGSSSSDDASDVLEIVSTPSQKTKRLRKRRASGSNKESETNADETDSGSENNSEAVAATGVPGISRGPAVERVKSKSTRKNSRTSSRIGSAGGTSAGRMSDGEFIATLNSLAQGGPGEQDEEEEEEDSDDAAPSAREIAAKVLSRASSTSSRRSQPVIHQTSAGVITERSISESDAADVVPPAPPLHNSAVPDDLLADLDRVFETIDTLDDRDNCASPEDVYDVDPPEDNEEVVESNAPNGSDSAAASVPVIVENNPETPSLLKLKRDIGHPIYNVIYSRGSRLPGGIGWNDEMRRFYNNSWKGEQFSLQQIWNKMNPSKNTWKIYTEDRFPKDRRFRNLKCFNCCEFGHTRAKCKLPRKPMVCYMCGEHGHHEPRCPNTICLRCGNKTQVFTKSCNACTFQNRLICPVCKVRGHTLNFCPDKWRRYHSTTEPNTYPNSHVEYKLKKCCCICAGRGHLSENCKSAVRFMEYPIIISEIKSHQKSYNDQTIRIHQTGIGFNLLYKPCEDFSFEMAENTAGGKSYYGRFLNAVGMGYMLKRKRKLSPSSSVKRAKSTSHQNQYVTNPYLKAGQEERTSAAAPDQVQEVTESGNLTDIDDVVVVEAETAVICSDTESVEVIDTVVADEPTEVVEITVAEDVVETVVEMPDASTQPEDTNGEPNSNFKAPTEVSAQSPKDNEPLPMDSDSNYSFSEHFEMPSTSTAATEAANAVAAEELVAPAQQNTKSRIMEPLPDFIPLSMDLNMTEEDEIDKNNDEDNNEDTGNGLEKAGISDRFVSATAESDEDARLSPLPDLPCEAKIYLTHFHSKYLLSPVGHNFLLQKSKECNIKSRLDWTSVGHVLIIFGLRSNQDHFHRELLLKYRELTDQMNCKQVESSPKVPRRIDVLVRFLRDNITQLLSNLGNVNELLKRMRHHENLQSKTGWKMAEKTRRLLNMILLGQAGMVDGSLHLDKLLVSLQALMNDYKSDEMAPNELRNEIESHWKAIFTSYRHDNYPHLVHTYNRMILKNRIPKLNIDPALLGQKMLDTSLTAEQKERLEQPQKQPKSVTTLKHSHNIVPNPLNPKNSNLLHKKSQLTIQSVLILNTTLPPAPSLRKNVAALAATTPNSSPCKAPQASSIQQQTKVSAEPATPAKKPSLVPPCANPEQKSNVVTTVAQKLESACESLLTEIDDIDGGDKTRGTKPVHDSKAPSMFWSRESMKYLDECITLVESGRITGIRDKLQRVQKKSQTGSLSYNDYRAVIKLHNAMLGK